MKILLKQQMINVDQRTIHEHKIPELKLMENAGIAATKMIKGKYPNHKNICLFIGSGNNGGDGLVIGRLLFQCNYEVNIFYVGNKEKASKSNNININRLKKLKIPIIYIKTQKDLEKNQKQILNSDIIIDAMLGIGLNNRIKGIYLNIIEYVNSLDNIIKVAIDIPTGLYADSSQIESAVFNTDETITFGAPKLAHILSPSKMMAGQLTIKNIGFPVKLINTPEHRINLVTNKIAADYIPERFDHFHKNDYGHIAVFAGSIGKSGAAVLCSLAALRSGAGLVTTICPEEINQILESNLIEVMTNPVDLNNTKRAFQSSKKLLDQSDVILAGCGLSANLPIKKYLKSIFKLKNKTFILDADALNIISEDLSLLQSKNTYILTPHIGELTRLLNIKKDILLKDIINLSCIFAKKHKVIMVIKSVETLIINPEGDVSICNSGNEGMATAGSGDVLAGIIAGFLAQNLKQKKSVYHSVISSVYIHGISGMLAQKKLGSHSLIASDLIHYLHEAIQYGHKKKKT